MYTEFDLLLALKQLQSAISRFVPFINVRQPRNVVVSSVVHLIDARRCEIRELEV